MTSLDYRRGLEDVKKLIREQPDMTSLDYFRGLEEGAKQIIQQAHQFYWVVDDTRTIFVNRARCSITRSACLLVDDFENL